MFFCHLLLQQGRDAAGAAGAAGRQVVLSGVAPGASVFVFVAIKLRERRHTPPGGER
jgi:hypothetical protein